jgi:hypothetical protein
MMDVSTKSEQAVATNSVLLIEDEDLATLVSQTLEYTEDSNEGSPYFIASSYTE